jgi:hypothetical protein
MTETPETSNPTAKTVLRRAYRKIAANRHCISGACGWAPPANSTGTPA